MLDRQKIDQQRGQIKNTMRLKIISTSFHFFKTIVFIKSQQLISDIQERNVKVYSTMIDTLRGKAWREIN